MSIVGYQSTPQVIPNDGGGSIVNSQREIALSPAYVNPLMLHSPGRNIIAVVNENIVIGKDIRIRSRNGRKEVAGWQISLPAPINKNQQGEHTGTLLSREGKPFYYAIDDDGRVFVSGEFKNDEDEIIFNINPYVAELPLKFRPFLDRQGPIPAERLIEEQDPVEEKPKRRKANRIKKSESTE